MSIDKDEAKGFIRKNGKWIVIAVVIVGVMIYFGGDTNVADLMQDGK